MLNPVSKESVDLTQQNIEKLKELFPEILTDGNKINFELLQTVLGEEIDGEKERYSFTWSGKRDAVNGAQQPSKGTLRPSKEKSKNFDTTENLYIEGDNLEVLKLLQKSYNNKVKVIYIDPPYNTGKDFIYRDNYRKGLENYLEQTGQVDDEGNLMSTNNESNGRFHTDWLNMMYPRLKLARNLLSNDGVIFISIDDNEQSNLKKICDEIFGEKNFISQIAWRRTDNQSNLGVSAKVKEYILLYAKNYTEVSLGRLPLSDKALKEYSYEDEVGKFSRGLLLDKTRGRHYYEVVTKTGEILNGPWMVDEEKFKKMDSENKIFWPENSGSQPRSKIYLKDSKGAIPNDFWGIEFGTNQRGSIEVEKLFQNRIFDFPKPVSLIKNILQLGADTDSYVLDFFSGSSTTAHATMQLNAEDGGSRKFVMVQLPELLEEESNGYRLGYQTISDIGSERIRRAGEKIIADKPELEGKLDIGFKYLELDKSNIKEWNTDFDNLEDEIDLFAEVFVEGRNELDVVYEIMLKNGLELTLPINSFDVNGKTVYDIAFGLQFICLADDIDGNVARAIIDKRDEYGMDTISGVVFKDAGFKGNDSEKLNCIQLLKDAGFIEENLQTI